MRAETDRDTTIQWTMRVLIHGMIVCLVLALFPFTQNPATPIKFLVLSWGVFFLALTWLMGGAFSGIRAKRPSILFWIALAFLAVNAFAALASSYPGHSLDESRRILLFVLVYLLAAQSIRTEGQAWRLMTVICAALALSSLYGFCQRLGWDPFPWALRDVEEYTAIPATFGNPNFAAHALLLGIIMATGLASRKAGRHWPRALGALMGAALLGHFLLTRIRSGVAALVAAAALVAVAVFIRRHTKRPVRGALLACVVVVLLGFLAGLFASGVTKARTGSAVPLDTSLLLRYNSNYSAARMIGDRPLLGYGPGNYVIENVPYWTPYEQDWFAVERKHNKHVHNDYLETATDAGLPALFLYLAFLTGGVVFALVEALRTEEAERRRLAYVLAACFFAFAVEGLFGFNVRIPVSGAMLFLLAGVLDGTGVATPSAAPSVLSRRKSLGLQCGTLLLAVLVAATQTQAFVAQYYIQRGKGAQYWNRPDVAHTCFKKAASLAPWEWTIPWELGITEADLGRPEAAIPRFERALSLNPHFFMARVSLADTHLDTVQSDITPANSPSAADALNAAERHAAKALAYCPKLPEAHSALGRVWSIRALRSAEASETVETERAWHEAADHYQSALAATNDARVRGQTQRKLALAYLSLGKHTQGEETLRSAVESDPSDRQTWVVFLDHARATRQYEVLIRALRRALGQLKHKVPPNMDSIVDVSLFLAAAYQEQVGNVEKAKPVLDEALSLAPERLDVWAAWVGAQDPGERRSALEQRLAESRADLAGQAEELPLPLPILDAAFRQDGPDAAAPFVQFAQTCEERAVGLTTEQLASEYGWAAQILEDELEGASLSEQERAVAQADLGRVFALCGMWEEADAAYAKALPFIQSDRLPRFLLAHSEVLARRGKHTEALALAQEALRHAPDDAEAHWAKAKRLAEAGRPAEARLEYRLLLESPVFADETRFQLQNELDALKEQAREASP